MGGGGGGGGGGGVGGGWLVVELNACTWDDLFITFGHVIAGST